MSPPDKSDQQLLVDANLTINETVQANGDFVYTIAGDTHPHRHMLRESGGKWNAKGRIWEFITTNPTPTIANNLRDEPSLISKSESDAKKKPHYHGHRERLRKRFHDAGSDSLPDYELLELLLFQCIPRIDVKPIAKQLIEYFGSLGGILGADANRLAEFDKISFRHSFT